MGDPEVVEKHAEIRQMISQVKGQQNSILQQLYNEQKCLEGELSSGRSHTHTKRCMLLTHKLVSKAL